MGHLFQSRFQGILVEKDRYLLELARYIVLNPVCAGMVDRAEAPQSQEGIRPRFVAKGREKKVPGRELRGQIYLGSERFVEQMQGRIGPERLA